MPTAVVTGATSGIGAVFVTHLAARGDDLVMVARDTARMEKRAEELRQAYGVQVEVLTADLSDRAQVDRVAERVGSTTEPVELLVNNAGFGIHSRLLSPDVMEQVDPAWEVMVRAVMVLSGAAGRAMVERGHGAILNVTSTAAFMTMGAYSAIKEAATVYTEGLSNELHGTGVTATALCPGYVHTEFHERSGIRTSRLPGPLWVDADELVRDCLADVAKGKVLSIPTVRYKIGMAAARRIPRALLRRISGVLTSTR